MNVNVESISPIKKKLSIEIPGDQVAKEVDSFYGELRKKARIKGFRPGKVPRNILERHFKEYVKVEVVQKLVQDTYTTAISETELHPVSQPLIDPGELESGKPFQYSATVEVKPEIKVEGYLGLKLEGRLEEVKEEEVDQRLKNLQDLHAHLKTIPEARPIQAGDFVIMDYEARLDGKPLEEGKGADYTVEVGAGRFIPGLEEKLIGLTPEKEEEIEVSFSEEYGYKKWAGKKILFKIKIKEIKEKILPSLDDEFAKDLGVYGSLQELKDKFREEVAKEKKLLYEGQLKDRILDQLLSMNPFDVPESLVEDQVKTLVSDTKMRLAGQGMTLDQVDVSEEKLETDYRDPAKKQVQAFLILEKIAGQEGITVSDEEVEDRLKQVAERTHQKLEAVKRYYEKNEMIPGLKAGMLRERALNLLLEKADVSPPQETAA